MSFKSRRLRVQLPCRSETIVDMEVLRDQGAADAPCNWLHATPVPCHSLTVLDLRCNTAFGTPCVDSPVPPACPAGFITPDVHPPCQHGHISLPGCANTTPPGGCWPATRPRCSWDTSCGDQTHCIWTIQIVLPRDAGTVLVAAEALPLLREQLERRLHEIEVAELSKEHLQARLEEIDQAEQELRRRDAEE